MENLEIALAGLAVVTLAMTLLWPLSLEFGDVSIVDPFRTGEDHRYAAMRERGGPGFPYKSLFTVFWLQALLLWIVSAPLFAAVTSPAPSGALDLIGAAIALAGIVIEALADRQLEAFKADPANRGRVLDHGPWRYSRHPDYFGNAVLWWGLYVVALGAGGAWTVFGLLLMTFLLLKVSGVTLLERDIEERRPAYAEYARRTSAFVPMPPRAPRGDAAGDRPEHESGSST
jgi:steroid 5-alpha reductase family enzyme